jgi:hypothetical protein
MDHKKGEHISRALPLPCRRGDLRLLDPEPSSQYSLNIIARNLRFQGTAISNAPLTTVHIHACAVCRQAGIALGGADDLLRAGGT